ncbi:hypothetical protein evm_003576 [Chilo suppressalis]|nr:hypothetical protein evm_003576 [Chilo suppressalis]
MANPHWYFIGKTEVGTSMGFYIIEVIRADDSPDAPLKLSLIYGSVGVLVIGYASLGPRFEHLRWTLFNASHSFMPDDHRAIAPLKGSMKEAVQLVLRESIAWASRRWGVEYEDVRLVEGASRWEPALGLRRAAAPELPSPSSEEDLPLWPSYTGDPRLSTVAARSNLQPSQRSYQTSYPFLIRSSNISSHKASQHQPQGSIAALKDASWTFGSTRPHHPDLVSAAHDRYLTCRPQAYRRGSPAHQQLGPTVTLHLSRLTVDWSNSAALATCLHPTRLDSPQTGASCSTLALASSTDALTAENTDHRPPFSEGSDVAATSICPTYRQRMEENRYSPSSRDGVTCTAINNSMEAYIVQMKFGS